ncbi:protein containing DUF820 [mine drainage metagenome]|uniref:Protein containing DUF820 n=1 Tax=mine drainage metagenome TaxID=410659 RepID=T1BG44_9ZZZZ
MVGTLVATSSLTQVAKAQSQSSTWTIIEILSPSTKNTDTMDKRLEYEQAGVKAYWIVDPNIPSLTVLRLEAKKSPKQLKLKVTSLTRPTGHIK